MGYSKKYRGDNDMVTDTDDTIRARAVWFLHTRFAYLPLSGNAERVDDVAAAAGDVGDEAHAATVIRRMAERTTAPVAYKDGTGETLVGLDLDSVSETIYWMRRYDPSELPPGVG